MKEAVHISGALSAGPDLQELLVMVARGDQNAFAKVYDAVCGPVLGLVRSVLRDPAQSEEVAQEVLVEVWRTAPSFQPARGSAMNWVTGCCATSRPYVRSRRPTAGSSAPFGAVAVWQNHVAQDARQEANRADQRNEQPAQVLAAPDAKTSSGTLKDRTVRGPPSSSRGARTGRCSRRRGWSVHRPARCTSCGSTTVARCGPRG
ncbi:sigma factor [Streptomyces sp. NPDC057136]|uniref:sigma factor n=1 Tax=Streptomyces sp. NPDC057136 TaxID=3346029 RepID=UPI003634AC3F